jgi:DinB superfamily
MDNSLLWARTVLTTTPNRWLVLTGSLPPDLLARRPAPSQWSLVECLQHLIDTEKVFQFRLTCFMQGADFPGFNPDKQGSTPGAESPTVSAMNFERLREESLHSLEKLRSSDLDRQARHAELGLVTLGHMISEWAAHDLNHTIQAERALMQPFIQDSGPWAVSFKNHAISP